MRIAYLDCFAGISGDMFLGALLDAGAPLAVLEEAVSALALDATLQIEKVDRSGIFSTKVHVLEAGILAEASATHAHEPGLVHPHEQAHPHEHPSKPGHEHPHRHEHAPENSPEHTHPHEHTHQHDDGLTHTHQHTHTHEEAPEHPHEHNHPHEHEHLHTHSHGEHTHDHTPSDHEHSHHHPHEHAHTPGAEPHPHVHGRSLTVIRQLIQNSPLPHEVKHFAIHTFELLGASEARIHNVPIDQIHFHEVGAVDAIVDIVAASAGIHHLGAITWFCSPINVGSGMVECAHGTFPVPAPATADLLRGLPTYAAHVQKELVTPTGAAILRALEPTFGSQPPMRVQTIGYGAGSRNPRGFPNVLRLSLGDDATPKLEGEQNSLSHTPAQQHAPTQTQEQALRHVQEQASKHVHEHATQSRHTAQTVTVLETALDDATPQVLADVAERALAAGALDVMLTPVIMKKGRPGTLITVLADPAHSAAFEHLLLRETTTLGIRIRHEERSCLDRRHETVSTAYGELRIKIGSLDGEALNVMPEYEDCRGAALRHSVPVKQVMQAALTAYSSVTAR